MWRQRLQRSLHLGRSKPESRYFQIASINAEHKIQNRTVVFRGLDEGDNLYFVTDAKSDKVPALDHHANTEIAWYFAKSREQYRLQVTCELLTSKSLLKETYQSFWFKLSVSAQQQFINDMQDTDIIDNDIPTNFIVVKCHVVSVDYLFLGTPQERYLSSLIDEKWVEHSITP